MYYATTLYSNSLLQPVATNYARWSHGSTAALYNQWGLTLLAMSICKMCEYGAKQSSCHSAIAIMWCKVMHAIRTRQIIEHIYNTNFTHSVKKAD